MTSGAGVIAMLEVEMSKAETANNFIGLHFVDSKTQRYDSCRILSIESILTRLKAFQVSPRQL